MTENSSDQPVNDPHIGPDISSVKTLADAIRAEIGKAIIGQDNAIDYLLIALFSSGHVLLEGPPGTAKTFLAQCFASTMALDFGRVQFTPDLMPGDILGSNLFNFQTSTFTLTRGPIFCDLLLADEINRTPPKTQAALLEAMQERKVTIDGETYALPQNFTVVATQNPIEQQGVYPLPEAQLDRFLFKVLVDYPDTEQETAIVAAYGQNARMQKPADMGITPQVDQARLTAAIQTVASVKLVGDVVDYIVRLVRATRETSELESGASTRAAVMLANAARARAALQGRDYGIPDDVKVLAAAVLRHRIVLSPTAEIEGRNAEDIVAQLIANTDAPR